MVQNVGPKLFLWGAGTEGGVVSVSPSYVSDSMALPGNIRVLTVLRVSTRLVQLKKYIRTARVLHQHMRA